jgi:hypothetical protein
MESMPNFDDVFPPILYLFVVCMLSICIYYDLIVP